MIQDETRKALAGAVNACRRALVGDRKKDSGDIGAQLEAPYGFDPRTGAPAALDALTYLKPAERGVARKLRDWHAHLATSAAGATEAARVRAAYDQMKYEIGYTALHRLCALRMVEARVAVASGGGVELVSQKRNSSGFKTYLTLGEGVSLGDLGRAFNFYLDRLYDEMARSLPSVFDRQSPASLVAPSPDAVAAMLDVLMVPALDTAWGREETLGWIFEDYNDPAERSEMREHDAPRNARELAVRNQFFTPRWVVEFLTDNTLGRLWLERAGETTITDACAYLPRDLKAPEGPSPCDPRDLRVLDPACGSGHFLLYAYDLFETIYREAWEGRVQRSPERKPLWEEFPDEATFLREVPRLIVAHNLYGVDIDPRCIQEAALSLWLRAHRSWQSQGIRYRDRPTVSSKGLVCAQAMPDAPKMLERLLAKLKPAVLGRLVSAIFTRAAEVGMLLRAESAIADTVGDVKREYVEWKRAEKARGQGELFGASKVPAQVTLDEFAELKALGDAAFWQEAEARVVEAIEKLTSDAESGEHFRNRLFAEELRHGLEFHELSRQRFDVILMNPPFGEPTESTKAGLDRAYPNAGHDLYAMFYERALEMLAPGGRVGAITNRAWLALPSLAEFRAEVLGQKGTVESVADFGYGVLNAKVETAAAVVRLGGDRDAHATWIRLVKTKRKADVLLDALTTGAAHPAVSVVPASRFDALPERVCGYWMSESLASTYADARKVAAVADVKQGTATADDFRFLRLAWEVVPARIGLAKDWARFAKGGEYRPYFDDIHLVVRWSRGGREIGAFSNAYIRNPDFYGRRGVTWPLRTNLRISPRTLPSGCAFGHKGPALMSSGDTPNAALLAVVNSAPSFLLLSVRLQTADASPQSISKSYEVGLIRDLPWPQLSDEARVRVAWLASKAAETVRTEQIEDDDTGETVVAFVAPPVLLVSPDGLRAPSLEAAVRERVAAREDRLVGLAAIQKEIDDLVASAYGFEAQDRAVMDEELEPALASLPGTHAIDEAQFRTAYLTPQPLDGERLPGGLDAARDVRVEHRRGKQVRLRDEATLCRVFHAPPAKIAAERRRLGLLRKEDLQRAAADVVSYAVGVAFGRWDVRLVAHPEWIPTFADPFDPLPPCPLGQLVDAKGLPAVEGHVASEEWLAARVHPTEAPYGPFRGDDGEVTARDYPARVAWEGVLVDDVLDDALPRRPEDGFIARVEAALQHLLGDARVAWEGEICDALEVKSLAPWLRAPGGFFADHLGRYSKSRRQAPIYWPLSTASGGMTWWVYAPRFDAETLPRVINRLRAHVEDLRDLRDAAQRAGEDRARAARHEQLKREFDERQRMHATLDALVTRGYAPHPDDGYAITASPLHELFRYTKWRETLEATWRELERGEHDWSHLAMCFRPDEVLEKCVTDRSLAIAHDREALYEPPATKTRKGKKDAAAKPAKKAPPEKKTDGAKKGRKPRAKDGATGELPFGDAPHKEEA